MADDLQKDLTWKERLQKSYRLVIFNFETFEELRSYKVNLLNVYILICSILLIITLLVTSILVFTPVKKLIPGYGDIEKNTKFHMLQRNIERLEKDLYVQEQYNAKLRKLLAGQGQDVVVEVKDKEAIEGAVTPKVDVNQVTEKKVNISPAKRNFVPPVKGEVSAAFNAVHQHFGCDIIAPSNTPIKATLKGVVIFAGWTLETGYTIGIQHSKDLISFYKHNESLLKDYGDVVEAGEAIAIIGNTGTLTDGPHLHFELWSSGDAIDPEDYIRFN